MTESVDDMIPPWEEFPTYERYTIGWRMGAGEDYRYQFYDFLKQLPVDFETRLGYLRRHRPAPLNWCDEVFEVLYPGEDHDLSCSPDQSQQLLDLGLIEPDAAYRTWVQQQSAIVWPWTLPVGESPAQAARYMTRDFWFFSRQLSALRAAGDLKIPGPPPAWRSVKSELQTGQLGDVDPQQGLLTLAKMLCAGSVVPPWSLGLTSSSFADSFEMDMGYTDAFRLWMMCGFDDDHLLRELLADPGIPDEWSPWFNDQSEY